VLDQPVKGDRGQGNLGGRTPIMRAMRNGTEVCAAEYSEAATKD